MATYAGSKTYDSTIYVINVSDNIAPKITGADSQPNVGLQNRFSSNKKRKATIIIGTGDPSGNYNLSLDADINNSTFYFNTTDGGFWEPSNNNNVIQGWSSIQANLQLNIPELNINSGNENFFAELNRNGDVVEIKNDDGYFVNVKVKQIDFESFSSSNNNKVGVSNDTLLLNSSLDNTTDIPEGSLNIKNYSTNIPGDDIISNGGFDSDNDWTHASGWTIGSGVASATGNPSALIHDTAEIFSGETYQVTFTISNYSGGGIYAFCGPSGLGTFRSANGTYVENIVGLGGVGGAQDFFFSKSGAPSFTGDIDNVSVIPLTATTDRKDKSITWVENGGDGYWDFGQELVDVGTITTAGTSNATFYGDFVITNQTTFDEVFFNTETGAGIDSDFPYRTIIIKPGTYNIDGTYGGIKIRRDDLDIIMNNGAQIQLSNTLFDDIFSINPDSDTGGFENVNIKANIIGASAFHALSIININNCKNCTFDINTNTLKIIGDGSFIGSSGNERNKIIYNVLDNNNLNLQNDSLFNSIDNSYISGNIRSNGVTKNFDSCTNCVVNGIIDGTPLLTTGDLDS